MVRTAVPDWYVVQLSIVTTEPNGPVFLWREDDRAFPFCCSRFGDFLFEHALDLSRGKLPGRWSGPVWCTVHCPDDVASNIDTVPCGCNTLQVTVQHVSKFFQNVQKLGTIFFIFVVNRYFVTPKTVKADVVSLLDRFLYFHSLKAVGGYFVVNDVDGMDCSTLWCIR